MKKKKEKPMTVAHVMAVALTPQEALARMKAERMKKKPTSLARTLVVIPEPALEKSPLERTADLMRRVIAVPKSEAMKPKRRRKH